MTKISFEQYLQGKVKIDKICDYLVEDINIDNKSAFFEKWHQFKERFPIQEVLNINKVWSALIFNEKTDWFETLPFNKSSYAVGYSAIKYYANPTIKSKEIFELCFNNMVVISKSSVFKGLEDLRLYVEQTFYEEDTEQCKNYLKVILDLDDRYRSLKPQNPDKFLTFMIISQGKKIQSYQPNKLLTDSVFFNAVTVKMIDRIIHYDSIGSNKLNNKKDSQSLNDIYHFFKKYYIYIKFDNLLQKYPEREKTKKMKI